MVPPTALKRDHGAAQAVLATAQPVPDASPPGLSALSTPNLSGELTPQPCDTHLKRWTTQQLGAATDNFSPARLLGEGGYGEVYRADLPDGSVVAVKRMGAGSTEGEAGFLAEVGVTGAVSHPHELPVLGVVRLPCAVGVCARVVEGEKAAGGGYGTC